MHHTHRIARMAGLAAAALVVVLTAGTLTASARQISAHHVATGKARIGGVMRLGLPHLALAATGRQKPQPPLRYHGGPVMPSSTTHVIYWLPSGYTLDAATYTDIIEQYFTDTAADSGGTDNVYSVLTQYTDSRGHNAAYDQTFAGAMTDTTPYPANGCPKYKAVDGTRLPVCLTDKQIRREVRDFVAANALPTGKTQAYFMVFPDKVGSCFGPNGKICAFTYYCAYHSFAGDRSDPTIYANIPYVPLLDKYCGTGQEPNGLVDGTLDSISHEHREMTNDPLLNAWFDKTGYEGSDKCAYNFGKALGTLPTGDYNQVINGHYYYTQREWSNDSGKCEQRT